MTSTSLSRAAIFGMAAVGAATLLLIVLDPGIGAAAPLPTGACCNTFLGCCGPEGSCREVLSGDCNGIADQFQGSSTTCAGFCATTTTLPAFGACCLSNGICVTDEPVVCAVNEGIYQGDGSTCETSECPITTTTLPPSGACCLSNGNCFTDEPGVCAISEGIYQGDGSTCETSECPITTTTLPPSGACCLSNGNCFTDEPDVCAVNEGIYQGDGSTCETSECPIATTTTTSSSTSTLPTVFLCGDANDDKEINATDALIALRVSVGTAKCLPQRCDYNGNGMIQSSDALLILKFSVGQAVEPMCPEGV